MSGYKRVNFYELCRLCATNQQKEKTHIFQEEGRKIQLQSKIQSCLSLKVCENDFLPKVVCSQCLHTLEECYTFRNECVSSETMLSSYFNNFRYTEDFKKSGKVYIKDTSPKSQPANDLAPAITNNISLSSATPTTVTNHVNYSVAQKPHDQPFYAVHMTPQNDPKPVSKLDMQTAPNPLTYNLNTINLAALKGIVQNIPKGDSIGNIAVSSNGEVINITPMVDLESILMQNAAQKLPKAAPAMAKASPKRIKVERNNGNMDGGMMQVDVNQQSNVVDVGLKYDKLPHIKSTPNNKYAYTIKIEDGAKNANMGQTIVVNQLPNVNLPITTNPTGFNMSNFNTIQNGPNMNVNGLNGTVSIPSSLTNWNFPPSSVHQSGNINATAVPNVNITSACPSNLVSSHLNGSSLTHVNGAIRNANNFANSATNTAWNSGNPITTESNMNAPASNFNASNGTGANLVPSGNFNTSNNNPITTTNPKPVVNTSPKKINIISNALITPVLSNLHPQNGGPVKQEPQSPPKTFPCDMCDKVFKRREHLYQHVKLHTGFRPFVCENCNKSFMRKEHLMRHMTSHSGLKNFTCDVCFKSFSRNDNLLKHKKTHDKQTSFTCEVCQKQFVMKHYYLAHKMSHDNDKSPVPMWVMKT